MESQTPERKETEREKTPWEIEYERKLAERWEQRRREEENRLYAEWFAFLEIACGREEEPPVS